MSDKLIVEETMGFLKKNGISHKQVEKLHGDMRGAKSSVDSALGLSPSNMYRMVVPITKEEKDVVSKFQLTYAAIIGILHEARSKGADIDLSSVKLVANEVKVKGQINKLSKVLSKYLEEYTSILDTCMKELKIEKHAQFLPKLGDIVKSNRKVVVSTNMLDLITGSDNASFRSCHSFDGCHFNGNIAYCRDSITAVAYSIDEKADINKPLVYKQGRSWMYVLPEALALAKSYGAFHSFERRLAMESVCSLLAKAHKYDDKWTFFTDVGINTPIKRTEKPSDAKSGGTPAYFDNGGLWIAKPDHVTPKSKEVELTFNPALCLFCGQTTNNPDKGECYECKHSVKCIECGERVPEGKYKRHGNQYFCIECFEKNYFACSCCGNSGEKSKATEVNGKLVCRDCFATYYSTCAGCNKVHNKDEMGRYPGLEGSYCDACLTSFKRCDVCGEWHPNEESVPFGEYYVCNGCGGSSYQMAPDFKPCERKPVVKGLPDGWFDLVMVVG